MPRYPGFIGGSYYASKVDTQRSINLYPEAVESGSRPPVLRGTPGTDLWHTAPKSPIRALWSGDDGTRCFVVAGDTLYEVDSFGTFSSRGAVGNDSNPAEIYVNGTQLLCISAGQAYISNGGAVSSVGMPTATSGGFIDGYFLAARPDSRQFDISEINDGTTWDALEYAIKEAYPDHIKRLFVDHSDVWLFGTESIEVWRNTGNADFPFQRDPGAFIMKGLKAKYSTVRLAGGVAFLGGDSRGSTVAYHAVGFQPKRVSTHAIETMWKSYNDTTNAVSFAYSDNGHDFWVIQFPNEGTWVYDATTQIWHERSFWDGSDHARWKPQYHCEAFGKHLVGDYGSGKIFEMGGEIMDDDGTVIKRLRAAPDVNQDGRPIFYDQFQLDLLTGAGTLSATLEYTDDGATWKTRDTLSPAYLDFGARVIWRRLGRSRNRAWRVQIESSGLVVITDAFINNNN